MTLDEIRLSLSEILSTLLKTPVMPDSNLKRDNTPNWNSLVHIDIILTAEETFDIRFSEDEIDSIHGQEDLLKSIEAKHAS